MRACVCVCGVCSVVCVCMVWCVCVYGVVWCVVWCVCVVCVWCVCGVCVCGVVCVCVWCVCVQICCTDFSADLTINVENTDGTFIDTLKCTMSSCTPHCVLNITKSRQIV